MAQLIIGVVLGLLLGAAIAWAVFTSRQRRTDAGVVAQLAESEVAKSRAIDLQAQLERERLEHDETINQLSDRFKVLADQTMQQALESFRSGQEDLFKQRESALDERLSPLGEALRQYQEAVNDLQLRGQTSLTKVEGAADRLLEAQTKALEETQRLNTLLGRSSHRGRWGEIQLKRILERSQMLEHVDFDTQSTVRGDGDGAQRPDVIVHLPGGARIAVDSKVPYDAYDRAMQIDDPVERDKALAEYATALKAHVTSLSRKSYFNAIQPSPSFVVCFVPSDFLLSAAFEADPGLLETAIDQRVLVAGPTSLLGLLWSAHLGWNQFESRENVSKILELARTLADRTGVLYRYVGDLGRNVDRTVKSYNAVVGSLESRLLTTVREIEKHGVIAAEEISALEPLESTPQPLNASRWPSGGEVDVLDVDEGPEPDALRA